jgi:adenylyltransferase/sulfurtransferase
MTLSEDEKTRYQRQLILNKWGMENQLKLKNSTVFVAGAGGSGSPILTQLALLGLGTIRICDFDQVELSNLNRQFIHSLTEDDRIGLNKAISAAKTINNINPHVKVEVIQERIDKHNVDEIVGVPDLIFDSVDHIPTKFFLSESSLRKKIPHLFYGMMDINAFHVTFNPPTTPCFHCLFDVNKVYEANFIASKFSKIRKRQTPVSCPALFLSTGFAVNEALKILLEIGEPAYNTFYLFLQNNSPEVKDSGGYAGMRYWITEHFYNLSLKQGYNWDIGWRNNMIEELNLYPDPACPKCSKL